MVRQKTYDRGPTRNLVSSPLQLLSSVISQVFLRVIFPSAIATGASDLCRLACGCCHPRSPSRLLCAWIRLLVQDVVLLMYTNEIELNTHRQCHPCSLSCNCRGESAVSTALTLPCGRGEIDRDIDASCTYYNPKRMSAGLRNSATQTSAGLIRGAAAISSGDDHNRDSERL